MPVEQVNLSSLMNIGPTIEKRLNEVGIHDRADLENVGPVETFRRVRTANPGRTVSVCYYLYSLQGALMGVHWDDVPEEQKTELLRQADR